MGSRGRPTAASWLGWYEGVKRPHRNYVVEITYRPMLSGPGELIVNVYDEFLAYTGSPSSLVAVLYRGYDFPRRHVLKPNNEPVASSGTLQACDLVVGNKLAVEPGKPPIVIRVAPDPRRGQLDYNRSKGVDFAVQPPDIGFDDAGVPEWPGGETTSGDAAAGTEGGEEAGEPQASAHQESSRRDPGDSDPAAGAGTADVGAVGADPE